MLQIYIAYYAGKSDITADFIATSWPHKYLTLISYIIWMIFFFNMLSRCRFVFSSLKINAANEWLNPMVKCRIEHWQTNFRKFAIKVHLELSNDDFKCSACFHMPKCRSACFKQLMHVVGEMDSGKRGNHIKVCYKWILMFTSLKIHAFVE